MFAIFTQTRTGLHWAVNVDTAQEAEKLIASDHFDRDDVDFIFALPGVFAFRDLSVVRAYGLMDENPDGTPAS